MDSIPGWEAKIPHATRYGQKKKKMWGQKEAEINLNYIFEPSISQMLSF